MSSLLDDLAGFVAIALGELAEDPTCVPIIRAGERVSEALRSPTLHAEIVDSDRFGLGPVMCDVLEQLARLADRAELSAQVRARLDLIFDLVPLCATIAAIDEFCRALPPVSQTAEAPNDIIGLCDRLRARIRAALADVTHDELGADVRQQLLELVEQMRILFRARISESLDVLLSTFTAIAAIANRVTYIRTRTRHVFAELGVPSPTGESAGLRTDIQTLEHFAHQWARLVPADVAVRAALARLFGCKYTAPLSSIPQLRAVCGWDTPEVRAAYRERFGAELVELFAESHVRPARDLALEEHAGWLALGRGEILCKQDDPGDVLYYLASGRLRVAARDSHGVEHNVGEIVAGEYVGETSILTGEPRSASVYALRDSELVVLDRETFDQLQSRETLRHMTAQLAARLRSTMRNDGDARRRVDTIAIVPARPDVSIGVFSHDVSAALAAHGPVTCLSRDDLARRRLELEVGTDSVAVSEWLDREETEHDFVVYVADAQITAWSKRCLRQADLVIIAVDAADERPWTGTATFAVAGEEASKTRCDVVLLGERPSTLRHRKRSDPYGSRLTGRYYVDPTSRADLERLARYIAGRAIGLVLGGGAARGYAHIGVVRALAEAGIPIDMVGGTSMGSLVAAAVAMGWTADEMLERLRIGPKVVLDFSLPLVSVARGIGFRKWLEAWVGDLDIRDLDIPYFCASANMTRAEVKIHTAGPLLKALMASNSGPVMLPPVVDNGDLLVDGGLLANVPWEAMRNFAEVGPLIAVDVVPPEDLPASDDYGLGLSGWRVAMQSLLPWRKALRLPSILELQMRAQLLASLTQSKHAIYEAGDLPIPIPLERFSLLGYGKIREIAEAGYQAAVPAIEAWKNREPVA
jgi:predicted acylesterase/phospholipase RssA/CRP-like cAMP-binding protein